MSGASVRWRAPVRIATLCAIALIASTVVTSARVATDARPASAASVVDVTAWAPYWKASEALGSFTAQSGVFSELTPFFFTATSATAIGFNPNMSNPAQQLQNYKNAAANAGKPIVATIVDAMPARGMAGVLSTPAGRTAHVTALIAFMINNGFSGIDLDYEQFAFADGRSSWAATHDYWGAFLLELSSAVHAYPGRTLAVSVPPIYNNAHAANSGYWVYNYPALAAYVDRVRIMTYSYSVSSPGPIAPYAWVSTSIDAALTILPPSKVVMGIPAYGTDWVTNVAGSCPVGVAPTKKNIETNDFDAYAAARGAIPQWNDVYKERTFTYVDTFEGPDADNITVRCNVTRVAWFTDADSIYQRTLLAQSKNLAGVALWALGYDDAYTWDGINNARANQMWARPGYANVAPRPAPAEPIFSSGPLPARYLDTRPGYKTADGLFAGKGLQPANSVLEVPIAGRGPVPAGTAAVSLNVTVIGGGTGYVTVYPCGERPVTSSLNVRTWQTVSNSVITKLSPTGTVCIYTQPSAQLLIDVFNILPTTTFAPLDAPSRLLDTRPGEPTIDGQFSGVGALGQGGIIEVPVAARGGMADAAKTAVLNVTAVNAIGNGYLTVWPCDAPQPSTSNVNYTPGVAIPNSVVTGLSANGTACVYSSNGADVVVDTFGELDTDTFQPLGEAARLMDTRPGLPTIDGVNSGSGKMAMAQTVELQVGSRGGLPPNPTGVILNVTVDQPELAGYVTVFPCGTARPLVSNVNFAPGQTLPNLVVTKLSPNGTVCVFSLVRTHVIVDVVGTLTL